MPPVPSLFFKLSKRLFKACPDAWVITPNERLAREFNRAYEAEQRNRDQTDWITPRAVSIGRFIGSHAESLPVRDAQPKLLSAEAELLLWQELGERDSGPLCGLAAEAWRLMHAYRIRLDDAAFSGTGNSRTFRRWARRFRGRLQAERLLTEAELLDTLPGVAEPLHLVAFDVITPQLADFLRRTEQAGGLVRHHKPILMRKGPRKRVEVDCRATEISAAAQWARAVLTRYPMARIGVVFPYLTDAYHAIAHAFFAEFAEYPAAVNLSGGIPLNQQPIWRDAELLLRFAVDEIDRRDWRRLRRSAWLKLGSPLAVPADLPVALQPRHLAQVNKVLATLATHSGQIPARQPFAAWIRDFRTLLAIAGWTGAQAASAQYQAHRKLTECLEQLSVCLQLPRLSGTEALQTLQRLLASRLFAPERPPAPVQVLGYLETTGLAFTHLWVAGLQDTAWPAPPLPNPLLPIPLQRLHGVPRTDHAKEAEFALAQTERWQRAARHLVLSHVLEDGEERHRASSLIESIPALALNRLLPRFRNRRHPWLGGSAEAELETLVEGCGSPVRGIVTHGGTAVIRNQAQCPFRAWAMHRLGLEDNREPQTFPDALERGTLVHEALFALYKNSPPPITEERIAEAADTAVNQHLRQSPELYRRHERQRLRNLLRTWVNHDAERPDFSIVGLEEEAEFALPGFKLSLRIDRIDRETHSGATLVIDYKTGNVSAKRLREHPLIEPQLPMYSLSDARIRAVLYAQIDGERISLKGIANAEVDLGARGIDKLSEADWRNLRSRWRSQIEALARQYRDGQAAVAPASSDICDRCHLPAFCRVHAMPSDAKVPGDSVMPRPSGDAPAHRQPEHCSSAADVSDPRQVPRRTAK